MSEPKQVQQIIGNLGGDPETATTSVGPGVRFSVAVTRSYPSSPGANDGETRWVSVIVFKPSIMAQVLSQLSKGSRVACEGVITVSKYQGVDQFGMKASRVGTVDFFLPSAEDKAAGAARAAAKQPAATEETLDW